MRVVVASLGTVMALAFGIFALPRVLTDQVTLEAVSGAPGDVFANLGPIWLLMVGSVVAIGAVLVATGMIRRS